MTDTKVALTDMLKATGYFLRGFIIILTCLLLAKGVNSYFALAAPAALVAMLILLALLATKLVPAQWLAPAAEPILKYMALFFIPAGVGLVEHLNLFAIHWPLLLLLLLGLPSVCLVLLAPLVKRIKFRD